MVRSQAGGGGGEWEEEQEEQSEEHHAREEGVVQNNIGAKRCFRQAGGEGEGALE